MKQVKLVLEHGNHDVREAFFDFFKEKPVNSDDSIESLSPDQQKVTIPTKEEKKSIA